MKNKILYLLLFIALLISGCSNIQIEIEYEGDKQNNAGHVVNQEYEVIDLKDIPEYDGKPYVVLNNNNPVFSDSELTTKAYEYYSPLDRLNRCGMTIASIGKEIMPTEKRGDIGHIKPSGWKSVRYDFVDGKSLYNRCHLIGFQLAGENDNEKNLITGTRSMNTKGMLPFENMIADYVEETGNHVAYRVTPIYDGNNLVAHGVVMEGYSIEDQGDGICFNVFAYNVELGVEIDYATGDNWLSTDSNTDTYILNTNNQKIHKIKCEHVKTISKENYKKVKTSLKELKSRGYATCSACF